MGPENFHFENTLWLWGLVLIPFVLLAYHVFYPEQGGIDRLKRFIDPHLIPHLVLNRTGTGRSFWLPVLTWSLLWALLMAALAGPRWNYRDVEVFKQDQSLVILLDLSNSMNADDEKPSRIARAKQEIEDILDAARGVKIALVAFAADPHLINPLTDDMEAIRYSLSHLKTDLIYVQGSILSPALEMASVMLGVEPGNNKSILLIGDGGFEDARAIAVARKLAYEGIVIHTLGLGSKEGAPIKNARGRIIRQQQSPVISRLEEEKLGEISSVSGGMYMKAHFSDRDSRSLLANLAEREQEELSTEQKTRHWEEKFYLLLIMAMAILIFWFRKGYTFPLVLLFFLSSFGPAHAIEIEDYFKNDAQKGKKALEKGDYKKAEERFRDPYRLGIVSYRAGDFDKAEEFFRQVRRPEVMADALYNLGNSLAMQKKFDEAVKTYETLLKDDPDHEKARYNLGFVKRLNAQRQQQGQKKPGEGKEDREGTEGKNQGGDDQDPQQDPQQEENNSSSSDSLSREGEGEPEPQDSSAPDPEDKQNKAGVSDKGKEGTEEEKNKNTATDGQVGGQPDEDAKDEQASKFTSDTATSDPEEETGQEETGQEETGGNEGQDSGIEEGSHADRLLNRVVSRSSEFLKNQFLIESRRKGTAEGSRPW